LQANEIVIFSINSYNAVSRLLNDVATLKHINQYDINVLYQTNQNNAKYNQLGADKNIWSDPNGIILDS
jgi:hypothetical protein